LRGDEVFWELEVEEEDDVIFQGWQGGARKRKEYLEALLYMHK
jgi:hypothetical protein